MSLSSMCLRLQGSLTHGSSTTAWIDSPIKWSPSIPATKHPSKPRHCSLMVIQLPSIFKPSSFTRADFTLLRNRVLLRKEYISRTSSKLTTLIGFCLHKEVRSTESSVVCAWVSLSSEMLQSLWQEQSTSITTTPHGTSQIQGT